MIYILRLISLPFMLALHVIVMVKTLLIYCYQWIRWGGEVVVYGKDVNRETIAETYKKADQIISYQNKKQNEETEFERLMNMPIEQFLENNGVSQE